jgi:hypothetical protein
MKVRIKVDTLVQPARPVTAELTDAEILEELDQDDGIRSTFVDVEIGELAPDRSITFRSDRGFLIGEWIHPIDGNTHALRISKLFPGAVQRLIQAMRCMVAGMVYRGELKP